MFKASHIIVAFVIGIVTYSMAYNLAYELQVKAMGYYPNYMFKDMELINCFTGGISSAIVGGTLLWKRKWLPVFITALGVSIILKELGIWLIIISNWNDIGYIWAYWAIALGFLTGLIVMLISIKVYRLAYAALSLPSKP